MKKALDILLVTVIIFLHYNAAWGQELQKRLELASPHDAIWVHLYYLQADHYDPLLASTPFVSQDTSERKDWAIKLKRILDGEGLYVQMNTLPRETNYMDTVSNKPFYTPFPDQLPEIYLEKTDSQWHYAEESTKAIPELYKRVYPMGTHQLVSLFSDRGSSQFLGVSLWQLMGLLILIATCLLLYFTLAWVLRLLIRRLSQRIDKIDQYKNHVNKIASVGSLYVIVWVLKLFFPLLQFYARANMVIQIMFKIILTVLLTLLVWRVIKLFGAYLRAASARTESRMDDQIVPMVEQILKIVVFVVALVHVLHLLDFNITALIAGVSIGGLALALAAQDTVKNFLGSVMIFADKPFQIGDWVEGSGFAGIVVEVGFRSTRIRTSDTSIISVPNGSMANISVNNKGVRQFRLYTSTVGVTYDTPADKLEFFIRGIREILIQHNEVSNDDYYVFFNAFGSSSLDIFIRCYMIAPTYYDELRIRESLQLHIVRWAEKIGVRFAFPSTTVYIEEMPGQISLTPTHHMDDQDLQDKWKQYFTNFNRLEKSSPEDVGNS
ncbi:MAG: mechanosensitive ion channel family protein [Saprospiraceae bacterium]|nr:mechanosensitive ion channel family protein [Saprospiraceae bacterium]